MTKAGRLRLRVKASFKKKPNKAELKELGCALDEEMSEIFNEHTELQSGPGLELAIGLFLALEGIKQLT